MDACREDMKLLHTSVMLGIETCNLLAGMRQTLPVSLFSLVSVEVSWFLSELFVQQGRNKEKFSF